MLAFAISSFGFSNLTISPDTIKSGETVTISGEFEKPGDTVDVTLWIDLNGDGVLEEGADFIFFDSKRENSPFIDGSAFGDNVADGKYNATFAGGPFDMPTRYVWVMYDDAGTDTAALVVLPPDPTTTYVKGTVTGPAGAMANIQVRVQTCSLPGDSCARISTLSDADGKYAVYLPDSWRGLSVEISTEDEFGLYEGDRLVGPADVNRTLVDSLTGIDFVYTQPTQFIRVTVVDQADAPMVDVRMGAESSSSANVSARTDSSGVALLGVVPGTYRVEIDGGPSGLFEPMLDVSVLGTDDTVDVAYKVYTADTTIKGKLIDEGSGIDYDDNVHVDARFMINNVNYRSDGAEFNADSTFVIRVPSILGPYTVRVEVWDIPDGFFLDKEWHNNVPVGATDVVSTISRATQRMRLTVRDQDDKPVGKVAMQAWNDASFHYDGETDQHGIFEFYAYSGPEYYAKINTPEYMNPEGGWSIPDTVETLDVAFRAYTTDASIGGNVLGELSKLSELPEVIARGQDTATGMQFTSSTNIGTGGDFNVGVASALGDFRVEISEDKSDIKYAVVPSTYDNPYPYEMVAPGTDTLQFTILLPEGAFTGSVSGFFGGDGSAHTHIIARDSAQGIRVELCAGDGPLSYYMPLPNGTYSVEANVCLKNDSCLIKAAYGLVIDSATVNLNFTPDTAMVVGVIQSTAKAAGAFSVIAHRQAGTGALIVATPGAGLLTVELLDLLGRKVIVPWQRMVDGGTHRIGLARLRAAGTYLLMVKFAGDKQYVHKQVMHAIR
jgi:hypothetical protein